MKISTITGAVLAGVAAASPRNIAPVDDLSPSKMVPTTATLPTMTVTEVVTYGIVTETVTAAPAASLAGRAAMNRTMEPSLTVMRPTKKKPTPTPAPASTTTASWPPFSLPWTDADKTATASTTTTASASATTTTPMCKPSPVFGRPWTHPAYSTTGTPLWPEEQALTACITPTMTSPPTTTFTPTTTSTKTTMVTSVSQARE